MNNEWKPAENGEGWIKHLTYKEYLHLLEKFQKEEEWYLEEVPEGATSVELRSYAGGFKSVFTLVAVK